MPKHDASDIAARLKSIIGYVQDCERRVLKGEIMDLQGLDKSVVEICDAVASLPQHEGRKLEDNMSLLIERLEALAGLMKDQQDKIAVTGGR